MAATRIQNLAKKGNLNGQDPQRADHDDKAGDPYIFAGDFNIIPNSPHYRLLTTGFLDASDATYPPAKHGVEWTPTLQGMTSAYALHHGENDEPGFTNLAIIKDKPAFMETLDYIFLSRSHDW